MLFKSLADLAESENLLGDFFYEQSRAVRYVIILGETVPTLVERVETVTPEKGKAYTQIPLMRIPRGVGKGNKCIANFMVENASYVFGWELPKNKKDVVAEPSNKKTEERFNLFKQGVMDALAAQVSGSDEAVALQAVIDFLNLPQSERVALIPAEATPMDKFAFQYFPSGPMEIHDLPGVDAYWKKVQESKQPTEEPTATCAILGTPCVPVKLHTNLVKFPGGAVWGNPIISFNGEPSVSHHGLEDNENCPVSPRASQAISEALRRLLDKSPSRTIDGVLEHLDRQNIRLTDQITACWWSAESQDSGFFSMGLDGANLDELKALLEAPRKGGKPPLLEDTTPFNLIFVQATQGRPTFLRYTQEQTKEIAENILNFCTFSQGFGIQSLLRSVIPDAAGKGYSTDPNCVVELTEAAISKGRIPMKLINGAIHRLRLGRAADKINLWKDKACLALITLALSRNTNLEVPMGLDTTNTNPAYLVGRYLAVVDKIQHDLSPSINKSVIELLSRALSITPSKVFSKLMHLGDVNLRSLERNPERKKFAHGHKKLLSEITDKISGPLPKRFSTEDQELFYLGRTHQTTAFYTKKEPTAEAEE